MTATAIMGDNLMHNSPAVVPTAGYFCRWELFEFIGVWREMHEMTIPHPSLFAILEMESWLNNNEILYMRDGDDRFITFKFGQKEDMERFQRRFFMNGCDLSRSHKKS